MITKTSVTHNKVGELCKAGGLKLAYHNLILNLNLGQLMDLLNETDKSLVDFEMDLYSPCGI
jgi:hypothetical protein